MGRGTREAITVMGILTELSIEQDQELYVSSVNFDKAFDRVNWVTIMKILKTTGMDWRDRNLIIELYIKVPVTGFFYSRK